MSSIHTTISSTLWNEYNENLPEAPFRMANLIVDALRRDGHIPELPIQAPIVTLETTKDPGLGWVPSRGVSLS
jgi:hypothetical protein